MIKKMIFLLLLFGGTVRAQLPLIDSFFKGKLNRHELNGQFLIAENNKITYRVVGGYADFKEKKLNTNRSQFNIASISKVFTSVAILQLKERGKLKLDDPVIKYLPEFPFLKITIRHLLSHTSGLPDIEIYGYLLELKPDTIVSNKTVLAALKNWDKGLLFEPGENRRYSNPGYSVLALLVEKISKLSLAEYLRKYIFLPVKMKDSYLWQPSRENFFAASDRVKLNVLPVWYELNYSDINNVGQYRYFIFHCAGTVGEKNIISTAEDLLRFDTALFSGKLLKPSTLEEAFTPVKLNNGTTWYEDKMDTMLGEGKGSYGLGFALFEQPLFGKSVGHGGFMGGLATFYFHNLSRKQTIIAWQNTSGREFGNMVTASFYLLNHRPPFQEHLQQSLARVYGYEMKEKGVHAATVLFNELRSDTADYYLSEQEMNWLGYDLLFFAGFENHKLYALEVHKVNSLIFPSSFNVYDSYAETLLQNGKKEEAIRMYKKSLQLNPNNEGGKEALKHLLEK